MMGKAELLSVMEHFQIRGRGLVLLPDFNVPHGWANQSETISLATPTGEARDFLAEFNLTHFKISDPKVDIQTAYRVVVSLPAAFKSDVPIGSKIFCSPELALALRPRDNA